ncbi:hypothetical protein BGP89_11390 [Luteimonas sp. JM171]|uniref:hypothetical protein n=1 Tax=Luteimonas sp. JM171 TaxID=1896164 RepID=UPI0008566F4D|nr:hypothetical protein [Luteimonas sp. JM171]AOH36883.1 hypothetical protein BGP89_11390 [Luteimonas sp. JM171]
MAGINGQMLLGFLWGAENPFLSADLGALEPPEYPWGVFDSRDYDLSGASYAWWRMAASTNWAVAGAVLPTFFEDFYNRIYITPRHVALGNVLSEQAVEIEVWNAWTVPQTLLEIEEHETEALTLTAPGSPPQDPPTTLRPLEDRIYLLNAATSGPSVIDASYTWNWSSGETITVTVTGARVVVWPFRPNWRHGVLERISFTTDVQVADDDTELRSSLSGDTWRRHIEFSATLSGDQFAAADALLWGWQSQVYGLPVWWDVSRLVTPAAVGALTLACDTADREFHPGGLVILTTGDQRHGTPLSEAGEIEEVLPGELVLVRPLQHDWPAGSAVCPGVLARLPDRQSVGRITAGAGELSVTFATEDEPEITPPAPLVTYQGAEVDLRRPLRNRSVDASYSRRVGRLDGGFGPVVVDDLSGLPQVLRQHDYRLRTRADQREWKDWLRRRRGQQVSQWTPTWQTELRPVANIPAGGTVLAIAAIGAASYFGNQVGRRHLLLEHRDGTQWLREVVSIGVGAEPGVEHVMIDDPLGVEVAVGDWKRVCWLERVRLAGDAAEIHHQTAEVAQATVGVRTVRA